MSKFIFFLLSLSLCIGVVFADESEYVTSITESFSETQETYFSVLPFS